METPQLSVIVPAFNEAHRLAHTLPALLDYLLTSWPASEVIVVDDGSHDRTAEVAEGIGARHSAIPLRVLCLPMNRGKGHAVREGLLGARTPIAVFTDADLSTPISELPKIVEPIANGDYDIVLGSRALNRKLIGHRQPWRREQSGRIFNGLVRLTTGLPFADTQCGFKAFRMAAARAVIEQATINGFGFDVELLYLAHNAGLRMLETPVRWDHVDGSKVRLLRDSVRMLSEVLHVRRRRLA